MRAAVLSDDSLEYSDSDSSDYEYDEPEIVELRRLASRCRLDHKDDYNECLSYCAKIVLLPEHDYVDIGFRGIIQSRVLTRAYGDGRWETERHRLAEYGYGALTDFARAVKTLEDIASGKVDVQSAVPPDVINARYRIPNLFPRILNARGFVFKTLGFYVHGERDFTRAIEMDCEFVVARRNRAILSESHGLFQLALNDYEEAIRLQPQVPAAYHNRGRLNLQLGNYADALPDLVRSERAYERARMQAVVAAIRWRLAFNLFNLRRWHSAEQKLKLSHDLAPEFPKLDRDLDRMENLAMDFLQFLPQVKTCEMAASALRRTICESFEERVEVLRFLVNWEFVTKFRICFRSCSESPFHIPFFSLF